MNKEQRNIQEELEEQAPSKQLKEVYNAPQIKVHGKLERMTLDDTYTPGGGGGGDIP